MKASAIQSVFLTRALGPAEPSKRVLVLGGDSTGLMIAENLAGEGLPVLILGYPGDTRVPDSVTVVSDTVLEEIRGFSGSFDVVLRNSSGRWVERVGFVEGNGLLQR